MPNARTGENRQSVPPHEVPPADRLPGARRGRSRKRRKLWGTLFVALAHAVGAITSVQAIMETRTAQGAVAWAVSLNMLPYVAVPAYWVFGRTKFNGHVTKRRADIEETSPLVRELVARAGADGFLVPEESSHLHLQERLAKLPATLRGPRGSGPRGGPRGPRGSDAFFQVSYY